MREVSTEDIKFGEHIIINGKEYVARKGKHDECKGCAFECEHCEYIPCGEYILKNVNEIEEPHGRSIDADKLTDTIVRCIKDAEKEYPKEDFALVKMVYESCLYHIAKAPTILEASK